MVTRVDPWSVLKTAFMLTLAFAIILLVAVARRRERMPEPYCHTR